MKKSSLALSTLVFLSLSFLIACGKPGERPPDSELTIVIGGSIAEGHNELHGIPHGQVGNEFGQLSFFAEQFFGGFVFNQAEGGARCGNVLDVIFPRAVAFSPDRIVINCGLNDIFQGIDPRIPMQGIFNAFGNTPPEFIIFNVGRVSAQPELDIEILSFNAWLNSQAPSGAQIIDYDLWKQDNQDLLPDGIHPSKEGYESLARFAGWVL